MLTGIVFCRLVGTDVIILEAAEHIHVGTKVGGPCAVSSTVLGYAPRYLADLLHRVVLTDAVVSEVLVIVDGQLFGRLLTALAEQKASRGAEVVGIQRCIEPSPIKPTGIVIR